MFAPKPLPFPKFSPTIKFPKLFPRLRTYRTHSLFIGQSYGVSSTLKNDDFADNSRDTDFWDLVSAGTGVATEQNEEVDVDCPAVDDVAGYVTKDAHDLTDAVIGISLNPDAAVGASLGLSVCNTKYTDRYVNYDLTATDCYTTNLQRQGVPANYMYVNYRESPDTWHPFGGGAATSYPNIVTMTIKNGTITVTWNNGADNASRAWGLPSYMCYIQIAALAGVINSLGSFDDFLGEN